jgi:mono/diheme cytochrome c family protein
MRRLALLLPVLAAACLSGAGAPAPPPERGEALAAQKCGGCHAIGPIGDSPRSGAPPFRELALRYNELSLEHRLTEMNGKPHWEMPQLMLAPSEIPELAAYIAQR